MVFTIFSVELDIEIFPYSSIDLYNYFHTIKIKNKSNIIITTIDIKNNNLYPLNMILKNSFSFSDYAIITITDIIKNKHKHYDHWIELKQGMSCDWRYIEIDFTKDDKGILDCISNSNRTQRDKHTFLSYIIKHNVADIEWEKNRKKIIYYKNYINIITRFNENRKEKIIKIITHKSSS